MSYTLQPLTETETAEYITASSPRGRLRTEIFTSSAIAEIFHLSEGIPRLINIISDNALLSGYALNTPNIGPEIILDSQGPGHRLIHEICELDKEFAAQHPVHLQTHRGGAVLAIEAHNVEEKAPSGNNLPMLAGFAKKVGFEAAHRQGCIGRTDFFVHPVGCFRALLFSKRRRRATFHAKFKSIRSKSPAVRRSFRQKPSLKAPSGIKGAAPVAENKKHEGRVDRQPGIAVPSNEDRTRASEIDRLQDQLRFLLQQLQTALDATAQLEQRIKALEKDLSLEKGSKGKLSAEASSKEAELQELRQTS